MLFQTAFVQINIAFSLCTDIFTEKLMQTFHPSRCPVKMAHNTQNTHQMTKIIWNCINWILVGIKTGAQMLLEDGGKLEKHKMTSIPKKILYKNGFLIISM